MVLQTDGRMPVRMYADEARRILDKADTNKDGGLSYSEYIRYIDDLHDQVKQLSTCTACGHGI